MAALRTRFDGWRATHPCALPMDAGAADAGDVEAGTALLDASATSTDAQLPTDAALVGRPDAASRSASTLDAARASTPDTSGDEPDEIAPAVKSSGCHLGARDSGSGLSLLLLGLVWSRRRSARTSVRPTGARARDEAAQA